MPLYAYPTNKSVFYKIYIFIIGTFRKILHKKIIDLPLMWLSCTDNHLRDAWMCAQHYYILGRYRYRIVAVVLMIKSTLYRGYGLTRGRNIEFRVPAIYTSRGS